MEEEDRIIEYLCHVSRSQGTGAFGAGCYVTVNICLLDFIYFYLFFARACYEKWF